MGVTREDTTWHLQIVDQQMVEGGIWVHVQLGVSTEESKGGETRNDSNQKRTNFHNGSPRENKVQSTKYNSLTR
jgi:hypothetical protein